MATNWWLADREGDASAARLACKARRQGRRTGAVMLVDGDGKLVGIFTDSDLARLFEQRRDAALDRPIHEVMTAQPLTVEVGTRVVDAVDVMQRRKISELPVVDGAGKPVGLIDITDLIGLVPRTKGMPRAAAACGVAAAGRSPPCVVGRPLP